MPEHRTRIRVQTSHTSHDHDGYERSQLVQLPGDPSAVLWDVDYEWNPREESTFPEPLEGILHDRVLAAVGVHRVVKGIRDRTARLRKLLGEA